MYLHESNCSSCLLPRKLVVKLTYEIHVYLCIYRNKTCNIYIYIYIYIYI